MPGTTPSAPNRTDVGQPNRHADRDRSPVDHAERAIDERLRPALDGVLVAWSKQPLQELAWASIGNVLTAIQDCEADDRGVPVP
jgi:hypothetical protein